jgi:DNA primase
LGSSIDQIIFNVDNLDYEEDLYACEGIGSIPKIYNNISENVTCTFGSNVSDYQINLLSRFKKRIILIPDNDQAGNKMIIRMFRELKNLHLIITAFEDTDDEYIDDILNTDIISAKNYVANLLIQEELFSK